MEDNITIIGRIALIIISLTAIAFVTKFRLSNRTGNQFFIIIMIFWSFVLAISIRPEILEFVLNEIGLANRAQFLLIISMGIILYLLYHQSLRNQIFSTRYHKLVRETALEQFSNDLTDSVKNSTKIVIIIVAKDEEKTIGKVIDDIHSLSLSDLYQIILVNDGSKDKTAYIAKQKNALVVNHFFNLGIGGAIKTGYLAAKFLNPLVVVNLDADGQHSPEYVSKMIDEIKNKKCDLVYASRFHSESSYSTSSVRSIGNKFYTDLVNKIGKISLTDVTSGYRAIRFEKIKLIYFISETNFAIELALRAAKNNLKIVEIPIVASEREHGLSQFYKIERFLVYNIRAIIQIYNSRFRSIEF